jgi:hypothetical protein
MKLAIQIIVSRIVKERLLMNKKPYLIKDSTTKVVPGFIDFPLVPERWLASLALHEQESNDRSESDNCCAR